MVNKKTHVNVVQIVRRTPAVSWLRFSPGSICICFCRGTPLVLSRGQVSCTESQRHNIRVYWFADFVYSVLG